MFKKLIIAAISASFVASAAFADSTNVGFRISTGNLAASGKETTNSATTVTQTEKDASFEMGSIFVERQIETTDKFNITVGLDFVPITADIAKLDGGDGFDATVSAGNLLTAYVQPTFNITDTISIFGKVGLAKGDLQISEISRQATTAGTASTDVGPEKSLEGMVYGIGAQMNRSFGAFDFVRLEATQTDFDKITHTNSNSKVLTADAEMELISLSIGKSF